MSTFFEKHGIRLDVAEDRGYIPWAGCPDCIADRLAERRVSHEEHGGDAADVIAAEYRGVRIDELVAAARQADGRVMRRYAPLGIEVPDVIHPEIRPDDAVHMQPSPKWHYHGWGPAPAGLPFHRVFAAGEMYGHIMSDSAKDPHSHGGDNHPGWHMHWPVAKYLFVPSKKEQPKYQHDHATESWDDAQDHWRHVSQMHRESWPCPALLDPLCRAKRGGGCHEHGPDCPAPGRSTLGEHLHKGRRRTAEDAQANAKRIDAHRFAMERLAAGTTEVVFAVLEGIPKNDAVLSHILDHQLPASVFNVPSVSLWRAPELRDFATKYLIGRAVVIVPDADWQKGPKVRLNGVRFGDGNQVIVQALLFRSALKALGVTDVFIAAPPRNDWKLPDDLLGPLGGVVTKHKGVDDSLAAYEHGGAGRSLADLEVLRRVVPEARIAGLVRCHGWGKPRTKRNGKVLRFLSDHADDDGTISLTLTTIGAGVSNANGDPKAMHRDRVKEALADLLAVGAIGQEGEFSDAKNKWGDDLADNLPVITLAPEYVARQEEPEPLGWTLPAIVCPGWAAL